MLHHQMMMMVLYILTSKVILKKVKSIDMIITEDMLEDNALLIQKVKKKFIKMLFV